MGGKEQTAADSLGLCYGVTKRKGHHGRGHSESSEKAKMNLVSPDRD